MGRSHRERGSAQLEGRGQRSWGEKEGRQLGWEDAHPATLRSPPLSSLSWAWSSPLRNRAWCPGSVFSPEWLVAYVLGKCVYSAGGGAVPRPQGRSPSIASGFRSLVNGGSL